MTLEKLRQIAAGRTKGEWESSLEGASVKIPLTNMEGHYFIYPSNKDADFIATISNHIDQLLAIAEEAKKTRANQCDCDDCQTPLDKALAALEAVE